MRLKPFNIPEKQYSAILYDCDGTLADTMKSHIDSWVQVTANNGVKIDPAIIHELAGMPGTKTVDEMNRRYGSKLHPENITQEKEDLFYREHLKSIRPIEAVVEHLRANYGKVKIAVVSGGRKRVVYKTLEILGVDKLVDVVICAEDVKHGKPDPEPFLMAAKRLGVEPKHCLVFEDAELGIESAKRAGMDWVRVEQQEF